jgi:hypothetical protein
LEAQVKVLDFEVFQEGMEMMCVVANREPNDILLSTYYALLKDLGDDQFRHAVANVLRDRKYTTLPLPADIRESALGKLEDEAVIALAKLEKATSTWGAYRSVIFDDPIIHAIVHSFGGWSTVCRMEVDEWKFRRIEFLKVYRAFAPNLYRLQIPLKLAGVGEGDHKSLPPKTIMIGNAAAIDAWHSKILTIEHKDERLVEILKIADAVI